MTLMPCSILKLRLTVHTLPTIRPAPRAWLSCAAYSCYSRLRVHRHRNAPTCPPPRRLCPSYPHNLCQYAQFTSVRTSSPTMMHTRPPEHPRKRPRYVAGSCKLLVVFAIAIAFVAISSLRDSVPISRNVLPRRSLESPFKAFGDDEEDLCYLVHQASDKCAWIRNNCPADEGGFTAILELYYCKYPHHKALSLPGICLWLAVLFAAIGITASDFFCIDLSTIATLLGMSETLAGVTLLALGNGSPDVFSTFAAMSTNSGSLAIGELYGAAGFISSVVAASMALVRPFQVAKKSFVRDVAFFAGAAAFSLVFLKDGKLHLWECIFMVSYYIVYVAFVGVWHWYVDKRRKWKAKEAAARGHFLPPNEDHDIDDRYRDDPEATDDGRPGVGRVVSWEDWNALEGQPDPDSNGDEDAEEQARDRWMSELASNMRVARPSARSRKNTLARPVRPSLVGALEFQSVLKSLQRSRNIQTIPLDHRRYSDDPTYTTLQQQDQALPSPDPPAQPAYQVRITDESSSTDDQRGHNLRPPQAASGGRFRAVSANDAAALGLNAGFPRLSPVQSEDNLMDMSNDETGSQRSRTRSRSHLDIPAPTQGSHQTSPSVRIEPATPQRGSPLSDNRSMTFAHGSGNLLAPPDQYSQFLGLESAHGTGEDQRNTPRAVPRANELPRIVIPPPRNRSRSSSRATSPFPAYRDYPSPSVTASTRSPASERPPSIYLPPAMASPESLPADQSVEQVGSRRPSRLARIWPYSLLPPPGVVGSALFPAFRDWEDKGWFTGTIAVVCVPIVFLLTISLPVVENERDVRSTSPSTTPAKSLNWETARSKSAPGIPNVATSKAPLLDLPSDSDLDTSEPHARTSVSTVNNTESTATVAVNAEQHYRHSHEDDFNAHASISHDPRATNQRPLDDDDDGEPELWNRWLTIIQLFTAPQVITIAIWLQAPDSPKASWLIMPSLISLGVSLVLLVPFLLTTTPTHQPRIYRTILSLVGFAVAVAWISAIASQVVGALKALAVICNISHAIMGLTIFAVGNSLGDLVADLTVAKLGYPVMALSACFGGPMLNILLGIGLAGTYNLVMAAYRRQGKHPGKGLKFKPVHIEVSQTLIVSGIFLLVVLVGLLIFVPLNKWIFDRKIAFSLVALWTVCTTLNVCIEVLGLEWGSDLFGS